MAFAQQSVNLTAGPATTTLPDGTIGPDVGLHLHGDGCDCHLRDFEPERRGHHPLVAGCDYRADRQPDRST